jgi:hypothetical protein
VTVRVEKGYAATPDAYTIEGKVYLMEATGPLMIGPLVLFQEDITIESHQPAPEWEPGTLGTAYFIGYGGYAQDVGMRAVRLEHYPTSQWDYALIVPLAGAMEWRRLFTEDEVFRFVPDETRPLPTRDEIRQTAFDAYRRTPWGADAFYAVADSILTLLEGES